MANAKDTIIRLCDENLGIKIAPNPKSVDDGHNHYMGVTDEKCIVTCTENNKPYVDALIDTIDDESLHFSVIVKQFKGRTPRGTGFGANLWRMNSQHGGSLELSFDGKPSEQVREELKKRGFRWSHVGGVWYLGAKKVNDEVAAFVKDALGMKEWEHV